MQNVSEPFEMRRIVTGHDSSGKAIVSMAAAPPTFPLASTAGTFFFEIWKTEAIPAVIDNGPDTTTGPRRLSPPPGGCAVRIVQIPPEDHASKPLSKEQIEAHFRDTGSPELASTNGSAPHPFMHQTETLDFGILIEGELTLILDDSEVQLRPGDVVVQRGTNHAWSNRGTSPCRIAFVLLDGEYSEEIRDRLNLRRRALEGVI